MKKSEIRIGMECLLDGEVVTVTGFYGVGGRVIVEGSQNGEEPVECAKLKPLPEFQPDLDP